MAFETTHASPVRAGLEIDEGRLLEYLQRNASSLPQFPRSLRVRQFGHGQSNPTYLLDLNSGSGGNTTSNKYNNVVGTTSAASDSFRLVLRKKPPGKILRSAHAVEREFQVLHALGRGTNVPVPRVRCLCTDCDVIGTPFYLMDFVQGRIFVDPNLPDVAPQERRMMYADMIASMAAIHRVDVDAIGLGGYGARGRYCARQVDRWAKQYHASTATGISGGVEPLPSMIYLIQWLRENLPSQEQFGLVHGDFRIGNLIFHPTEPRVIAVLDWELSTLGDPLSDVAYSCLPYHYPPGVNHIPSLLVDHEEGEGEGEREGEGEGEGEGRRKVAGKMLPLGVPSEQEYLEEYRKLSGSLVHQQTWNFYLALSLFRLASILAGVYQRSLQGNASAADANQKGGMVGVLADLALRIISRPDPGPAISAGGGIVHLLPKDGGRATDTPVARARREIAGTFHIDGTAAHTNMLPVSERVGGGGGGGEGREGGGGKGGRGGLRGSSRQGKGAQKEEDEPALVVGFEPSAKVQRLHAQLLAFMEKWVIPNEHVFQAHATSDKRWTIHPLMEELKSKAREAGLWNLWVPLDSASLASKMRLLENQRAVHNGTTSGFDVGLGLTNLEYAPLCEIMGRSVWAPEIFNCSAPDTGNMEVLLKYGTPLQQQLWLKPLLEGSIRSCFAMTEPTVASSDATNIQASIRREGNRYILNGRKWWTSGAMDPRCKVAIFMGKTDPAAPLHAQQSMILVDMESPGVKIIRPLTVFGYEDAPHGHAEVSFENVSVPAENLLLGEGRGFEIAQGRLGPGRLHHCMRLIGMAERAMERMARRARERKAFGKELAMHGGFLQQLAECRIEIEKARLLVLNAAHKLDRLGNKAARGELAIAKVAAPNAALKVIDTAIQLHGGAGVSGDFPLAYLWANARSLRIADGPDEVHLGTIAKLELAKSRL